MQHHPTINNSFNFLAFTFIAWFVDKATWSEHFNLLLVYTQSCHLLKFEIKSHFFFLILAFIVIKG